MALTLNAQVAPPAVPRPEAIQRSPDGTKGVEGSPSNGVTDEKSVGSNEVDRVEGRANPTTHERREVGRRALRPIDALQSPGTHGQRFNPAERTGPQ